MPEKVAYRATDEGEKLAISTFHIILSGPPKGDFRGRVVAVMVFSVRPSRPSPSRPRAPSLPPHRGTGKSPPSADILFRPLFHPCSPCQFLSFICREVTAVCQQFDCLRLHTTALDCAADCRTICPCPVAHTCLPPPSKHASIPWKTRPARRSGSPLPPAPPARAVPRFSLSSRHVDRLFPPFFPRSRALLLVLSRAQEETALHGTGSKATRSPRPWRR